MQRPFQASVAEVESSIAFFVPRFVFASDEQYYPCDIEFYLRNCSLYFGKHRVLDQGLVSTRTFSEPDVLAALCRASLMVQPSESEMKVPVRAKQTMNLRLENVDARVGFGPYEVNSSPVYVLFRERDDYDEIIYCTFCQFISHHVPRMFF